MTAPYQTPLRLALIGMSGTGKTFWTKKLAQAGHQAIGCDDRIEQRLRPQLAPSCRSGIGGVAGWMGWPDSPGYAEREAKYLTEEIAVLDDVLNELAAQPQRQLVLDTTGSVIYAGNNVLLRLRKLMAVVHLAASPEEEQLLIQRYLADPKPVLWRGAFQPRAGESSRETVARCYPALIASRRRSYEALAHCAIPIRALRDAALGAEGLLGMIQEELERAR